MKRVATGTVCMSLNFRRRRASLLSLYSLFLALVFVAILIAAILAFKSSSSMADRLAEVADIVGIGTALLAVLAGFIALQAYAAATGLPDLKFQVWFGNSRKNYPVLRAHEGQRGFLESTGPPSQARALVTIRNKGRYSARDPLLIIKISPIQCMNSSELHLGDHWRLISFPDVLSADRELVLEWTGGLGGMIHGRSSRRLPDLQLGPLARDPSWPVTRLNVEVVADGAYRRAVDIPIHFVVGGSSQAAMPSRFDGDKEWM
jgi:hypothetical protein